MTFKPGDQVRMTKSAIDNGLQTRAERKNNLIPIGVVVRVYARFLSVRKDGNKNTEIYLREFCEKV